MTVATAFLVRELRERWPIVAAAAVAGILPLLAPLLPTARFGEPSELRLLAATIIATIFSAVLAAMLGGTIIGRELSSGRISFYLARPISSVAFTFLKLLAAMVLSLTALGLVCLPSYLLDPLNPDWVAVWTQFLPVMALLLGLLALLSHVLFTFFTARTPWTILPLSVSIGGLWVLALMIEHRLLLVDRFLLWSFVPAVALLILLVLTTFLQVDRGRRDHRRGARIAAIGSAAAVVAVCTSIAVFLLWITAVTPHQLDRILDVTVGQSGWCMVSGKVERLGATIPATSILRWDRDQLEHLSIQNSWPFPVESTRSADGSYMTFVRYRRATPQLWITSLGNASPEPELVSEIDDRPWTLAVANDGSLIGCADGDQVVVYRRDGTLLSAIRWPQGFNHRFLLFTADNELLIAGFTGSPQWVSMDEEQSVAVYRHQPGASGLIPIATVDGVRRRSVNVFRSHWRADGSACVLVDQNQLILVNTTTGHTTRWAPPTLESISDARWLADGRLLVSGLQSGRGQVTLFDGPATETTLVAQTWSFPTPDRIWLGGEITSGQFLIARAPGDHSIPSANSDSLELSVATIADGSSVSVSKQDWIPNECRWRWWGRGRTPDEPGALTNRLLLQDDRLGVLDPASLTITTVSAVANGGKP